MNHCDLEETKRLVWAKVDEAIADADGWAEIRQPANLFLASNVGFCNESHNVSAIMQPGEKREDGSPTTAYSILLNGVWVGGECEGSDRHAALHAILNRLNDAAECERLLVALNPQPPKRTDFTTEEHEWLIENGPWKANHFAVLGAVVIIGLIATAFALAIWGGQ